MVWIATCVFESGRSHGRVPLRRSSAILAFSLCASTIVSGMHSLVSSVAYPNIKPLKVGSVGNNFVLRSRAISAQHNSEQEDVRKTDLVPSSNVLFVAVNVDTLGYVRRLLLQGH